MAKYVQFAVLLPNHDLRMIVLSRRLRALKGVNVMLVRRPDILAGQISVIWSKEPEIALLFNAMSAVIPHVEHYLNSVIAEVRDLHTADDAVLRGALDAFIGQETEHSRIHMQFNRVLFDAGYADLRPLLKAIIEEYRALKKGRSLAFHTAYCAGFENAATFSAKYILGPGLKHFEGADASGANLILWHVAEEFEHRSVCHDAFRKVSGNYFLRIWGLFRAFSHVMYSFKRAFDVCYGVYTKDMSPLEKRLSHARLQKFLIAMFMYMGPSMLVLFVPFFHPSKVQAPDSEERALQYFSSGEALRENFGDLERSRVRAL